MHRGCTTDGVWIKPPSQGCWHPVDRALRTEPCHRATNRDSKVSTVLPPPPLPHWHPPRSRGFQDPGPRLRFPPNPREGLCRVAGCVPTPLHVTAPPPDLERGARSTSKGVAHVLFRLRLGPALRLICPHPAAVCVALGVLGMAQSARGAHREKRWLACALDGACSVSCHGRGTPVMCTAHTTLVGHRARITQWHPRPASCGTVLQSRR